MLLTLATELANGPLIYICKASKTFIFETSPKLLARAPSIHITKVMGSTHRLDVKSRVPQVSVLSQVLLVSEHISMSLCARLADLLIEASHYSLP